MSRDESNNYSYRHWLWQYSLAGTFTIHYGIESPRDNIREGIPSPRQYSLATVFPVTPILSGCIDFVHEDGNAYRKLQLEWPYYTWRDDLLYCRIVWGYHFTVYVVRCMPGDLIPQGTKSPGDLIPRGTILWGVPNHRDTASKRCLNT